MKHIKASIKARGRASEYRWWKIKPSNQGTKPFARNLRGEKLITDLPRFPLTRFHPRLLCFMPVLGAPGRSGSGNVSSQKSIRKCTPIPAINQGQMAFPINSRRSFVSENYEPLSFLFYGNPPVYIYTHTHTDLRHRFDSLIFVENESRMS